MKRTLFLLSLLALPLLILGQGNGITVNNNGNFPGNVTAGGQFVGNAVGLTNIPYLLSSAKGLGEVSIIYLHDDYTAAVLSNSIAWWKADYTPITFAQFTNWFNRGAPLPPKPLLITCDDGYATNYNLYKDIFINLNCPATFFIVSGFVNGEVVPTLPTKAPMTWAQARELATNALFAVQDHSYMHADMSLMSYAQAYADLSNSVVLFHANMGYAPCALAYPYGYYNSNTLSALSALGYNIAFRTGEASNAANAVYCYLPCTWRDGRYEINRGAEAMASYQEYYVNMLPDISPASPDSANRWTLATGSTYGVDTNGDTYLELLGSNAGRYNQTRKIPVQLGDFLHLEYQRKGTYVGGVTRIQLQYYSYNTEGWIENTTVSNITTNDTVYVKINYDFRITNALAGWVMLAVYSDASSTGNVLDMKNAKMCRVRGMDSISGSRQVPKSSY